MKEQGEKLASYIAETLTSGYVLLRSDLPPIMEQFGYSPKYGPQFMHTQVMIEAVESAGGEFCPRRVGGITAYYDSSLAEVDTDMGMVLDL